MKKYIKTLERHNVWRRGKSDEPMVNPTELGISIDEVLKAAKRYEMLLAMNRLQLAAFVMQLIAGECTLDAFVDAEIAKREVLK